MKDLIKLHVAEVYGFDSEELSPLGELHERLVTDDYEGALPKVYDRRAVSRPEPWESGYHRRALVNCVRAAIRRINEDKARAAGLADYWQGVEDDSTSDAQVSRYDV